MADWSTSGTYRTTGEKKIHTDIIVHLNTSRSSWPDHKYETRQLNLFLSMVEKGQFTAS